MTDWSVEVTLEEDRLLGDLPPDFLAELERAATAVLTAEGAPPIELSIALLSDDSIAALNREYLSHAGPTDVISFPLEQPGVPLVGDVYVGAEQARRQAEEAGVQPREELLRLVIHGTLHVLGWGHPDGAEDSEMHRRQEEILHSLLRRQPGS
jgi:probable rRNA maturation factor